MRDRIKTLKEIYKLIVGNGSANRSWILHKLSILIEEAGKGMKPEEEGYLAIYEYPIDLSVRSQFYLTKKEFVEDRNKFKDIRALSLAIRISREKIVYTEQKDSSLNSNP